MCAKQTVTIPKSKPRGKTVEVNNKANEIAVIGSGIATDTFDVPTIVLTYLFFAFQIPKHVITAISTDTGTTITEIITEFNNAFKKSLSWNSLM
ncbi:MAG: hypothetical protein MJ219_03545 [Mycoplasmoidaceae bacterium]|nr:hypothetical protein [Mycoplasmoidaceae bacterium]